MVSKRCRNSVLMASRPNPFPQKAWSPITTPSSPSVAFRSSPKQPMRPISSPACVTIKYIRLSRGGFLHLAPNALAEFFERQPDRRAAAPLQDFLIATPAIDELHLRIRQPLLRMGASLSSLPKPPSA